MKRWKDQHSKEEEEDDVSLDGREGRKADVDMEEVKAFTEADGRWSLALRRVHANPRQRRGESAFRRIPGSYFDGSFIPKGVSGPCSRAVGMGR